MLKRFLGSFSIYPIRIFHNFFSRSVNAISLNAHSAFAGASAVTKVVKYNLYADPTIRAILLLVASESITAGAIASNFDTARPTVSKHLQILTECELLEQEQKGREIYYHLNPQKIKEIADFIEPFRKMWVDRFNKLETIMKKYKSKK